MGVFGLVLSIAVCVIITNTNWVITSCAYGTCIWSMLSIIAMRKLPISYLISTFAPDSFLVTQALLDTDQVVD